MTLQTSQDETEQLRKSMRWMWFIVGILAVGMTVTAFHVISRQRVSDHRNERQREAICSLIDGVPAAKSTPQILKIRVAYQCGPPHAPFVVTSPSP